MGQSEPGSGQAEGQVPGRAGEKAGSPGPPSPQLESLEGAPDCYSASLTIAEATPGDSRQYR